jgi:adenine-specific DNA-methyltransferase
VAAIDDLIGQIEDKALRERLRTETDRITKEKKFGLVFENHLPELTPIYSARVRKHSKVALRNGSLTDLWRVLSVGDGKANCRNIASGEIWQHSTDDLVVVRQLGEPIFPALVPVDKVQNGPDDAPWHTLIEADNYHALQLLEYLYAGQVDCIYIDPPYNTGARDWKYNNDYVDSNDRWRHSKWLAMMQRRLKLSLRLLRATGVLCVTIDDHEIGHLISMLEALQGFEVLGIALIKNKPQGRPTAKGFSVQHEYAIFIGKEHSSELGRLPRRGNKANRYPEVDDKGIYAWSNFRKSGGDSKRTDRVKQFYPVLIKGNRIRIPEMRWDRDSDAWVLLEKIKADEQELLPVDDEGNEKVWTLGHDRAREDLDDLVVRETKGGLQIFRKYRPNQEGGLPGSWWDNSVYSASESRTKLLSNILKENSFSFPKSLYAVADCLRIGGGLRQNALILDFFAGSGTTLHAVNLLNVSDDGNRRCILVTNNEVSEDEATLLSSKGNRPGNNEWEQYGICQSVTWPRSKYTILGKRDDGSELEGEYFTGKTTEKEKPRKFQQVAFTSINDLTTAAKKKQLVALIDGIPQSEVKKDSVFVVSEKHPASILFDESQADDWLEAL